MTKGPMQLLNGRLLLQINSNDVCMVNDTEQLLDGYVNAIHGHLSPSDQHDP